MVEILVLVVVCRTAPLTMETTVCPGAPILTATHHMAPIHNALRLALRSDQVALGLLHALRLALRSALVAQCLHNALRLHRVVVRLPRIMDCLEKSG